MKSLKPYKVPRTWNIPQDPRSCATSSTRNMIKLQQNEVVLVNILVCPIMNDGCISHLLFIDIIIVKDLEIFSGAAPAAKCKICVGFNCFYI